VEEVTRDALVHAHALSAAAVAEALDADVSTGLAPAEAARRLAETGPNELLEKPRPGFLFLLLGQLKDFLVIILIVAAVISIALGE
jgi:Ca2+-transporting ATPase